jgi:protoporphyrinogen oxidase
MKIAIIGAGPAGILLAHYLQECFPEARLELYEKQARAGGQAECVVHGGIVHPFGTCFTHQGYRSIHGLMKRFGEVGQVTSRQIHYLTSTGDVRPLAGDLRDILGMLAGMLRLSLVRRTWQRGGQETDPTWVDNGVPFHRFLERKPISLSSELFRVATTGQLYGPPEAITTFNALQWYSPALFMTALRRRVQHLPGGFERLFERILASSGGQLRLGSEVQACVPEGGRVRLYPQAEVYDHVFITVPPDRIVTPLQDRISATGPYADQHVVSLHVQFEKAVPERRIYTFDAAKHLRVMSSVPLGDDEPRSPLHWVLARFGSDAAALDDDVVVRTVLHELRTVRDFGEISVVGLRRYRYNVHYSAAQLAAGLPQYIDAMQGMGHVWYGGGAVSHWDVESIAVQSRELVARFADSLSTSAR